MSKSFQMAPELVVQRWFNSSEAISLAKLRGKIVVIEAFQMLCPGCVSHGLPQAKKVYELFPRDQVQVLGLHTVFEHHSAMTPVALEAFIHEYRIRFPVGVDTPGEHPAVPQTMMRYRMQGTPTLILIDRLGRLRKQQFGMEEDLKLGAEIMSLMRENVSPAELEQSIASAQQAEAAAGCNEQACALPEA